MARKFHLVGGSPGRKNHPVPTVDPVDLKSVWATQDEIQALYPGSRSMIAIGFCERMQPGRRCPRNFSQSIVCFQQSCVVQSRDGVVQKQ
jgi:hypothetical protein